LKNIDRISLTPRSYLLFTKLKKNNNSDAAGERIFVLFFIYLCGRSMEKQGRNQIIDLVKREVVPAIGCTEPVAVALCVAKATELLGRQPRTIEVKLSRNVLKNAMGVGIPGTGMIGLPIAIALGAIAGKPDYNLEVLKDIRPDDVAAAKQMVDGGAIDIDLKEETTEKLYIEAICRHGDDSARAIIAGNHTRFDLLEKNNTTISKSESGETEPETAADEERVDLSMKKVWDFATTAPLEEIEFIARAGEMNKAVAEMSFTGDFGHGIGRALTSGCKRHIVGDNVHARILAYTSAACDARMVGAMQPVMTNSGSGNQGISSTVPVVIYAEENGNSREELIRALMLSSLTVIYIKQSLGRLSALCGCVVATTGSSCGITYLMGGGYDQICYAVKNMIANLTGMICDGAKPSCSLKVTSGASTAVLSAMLAMEQKCASSIEGIIDDDVDRCILNLTQIGSLGMEKIDELVLDIMTRK
jgi:L-cysteine desulfidase